MNRTQRQRKTGSFSRLLAILGLVSLVSLAAAGLAFAQDPTAAQYANPVNQVSGSVGGGGGGSTPSTQQTSGLQENVVNGLPFTGLDVIALCAVALALTSIGFALRRMTDSHSH